MNLRAPSFLKYGVAAQVLGITWGSRRSCRVKEPGKGTPGLGANKVSTLYSYLIYGQPIADILLLLRRGCRSTMI
jgi:hypothetical protein